MTIDHWRWTIVALRAADGPPARPTPDDRAPSVHRSWTIVEREREPAAGPAPTAPTVILPADHGLCSKVVRQVWRDVRIRTAD